MEQQRAERHDDGEVRQPTDQDENVFDTGRDVTCREHLTDQRSHVEFTGDRRPDGEGVGALHEVTVARHHSPGDCIESVRQLG